MTSDREKLKNLLTRLSDPRGAPLDDAESRWLDEMRGRYPFFNIPGNNPTDNQGINPGSSLEKAAPSLREVMTAPSPETLARIKGDSEATRFDNFYPAVKKETTPSTNAAIDDFLATYGNRSDEEDRLIERLIFNPVPDYERQLAREEESSLPELPPDDDPDSRDSRLNRFILGHHQEQPIRQDQPVRPISPTIPVTPDSPVTPHSAAAHPAQNSLLSESLAKIYIKTRRYEQAYEILNGLSLRFPEKSSYFADQLRFLRKLILNEQRKRGENRDETQS